MRETVDELTQAVVRALLRSRPGGGTFHIEDVQDQVELGLMRGGHHDVARAYVLYRDRRNQERAEQKKAAEAAAAAAAAPAPVLHVTDNGQRVPLDQARLLALIEASCRNLNADIQAAPIVAETLRNLYDGVPIEEVFKASILAARTLIEKDPDYTYVTARLLLHTIVREVMGHDVQPADIQSAYAAYFPGFIQKGVDNELLNPELLNYDLPAWLPPSRPNATSSSTTWACRPCTTATSCTCARRASSCPSPSSCAWPWAWRCRKRTATRAPSSSTNCCLPSTS